MLRGLVGGLATAAGLGRSGAGCAAPVGTTCKTLCQRYPPAERARCYDACFACNGDTSRLCPAGGAPIACCAPAQVCLSTGTCCTPATCQAGQCGNLPDGCGGTLNCGSCTPPQTCGGGGTPGVCGCTPTTTCPVGANCGSVTDNCGQTVSCGNDCSTGQTCQNNVCTANCTPNCTGKSCGDDGCGGSCGTCGTGQTCSNGACQTQSSLGCTAGSQCESACPNSTTQYCFCGTTVEGDPVCYLNRNGCGDADCTSSAQCGSGSACINETDGCGGCGTPVCNPICTS